MASTQWLSQTASALCAECGPRILWPAAVVAELVVVGVLLRCWHCLILPLGMAIVPDDCSRALSMLSATVSRKGSYAVVAVAHQYRKRPSSARLQPGVQSLGQCRADVSFAGIGPGVNGTRQVRDPKQYLPRQLGLLRAPTLRPRRQQRPGAGGLIHRLSS